MSNSGLEVTVVTTTSGRKARFLLHRLRSEPGIITSGLATSTNPHRHPHYSTRFPVLGERKETPVLLLFCFSYLEVAAYPPWHKTPVFCCRRYSSPPSPRCLSVSRYCEEHGDDKLTRTRISGRQNPAECIRRLQLFWRTDREIRKRCGFVYTGRKCFPGTKTE